MDVSAIQSGIASVLEASAPINRVLTRLKSISSVPNEVCSLKNEVVDLEVTMRQLAHRLDAGSQPPLNLDVGSLQELLSRAGEHLSDVVSVVEALVSTSGESVEFINSNSFLWIKAKRKLGQPQKALKTIREEIISSMKAFNSELVQSILTPHQALLIPSESVSILEEDLQAFPRDNQIAHEDKSMALVSGDAQTLRICVSQHINCRDWCQCSCHLKRQATAKVPEFMERLVGKMFVGYSATPVFGNPCHSPGCKNMQESTVTMEYWFPKWFVSMNMRAQVTLYASSGPQLQLYTARRVPDMSPSVVFAHNGDIEGLKHLFSQGLATAWDVSESRGFSLMRWALKGGMDRYETVKFLIGLGAPVDEITYEHVCDFVLRGKCNDEERRQLSCVTSSRGGDWIEEQNFPPIHRIVLGLSGSSLAAELEENPGFVALTDAQGRTALDWAAARAQLQDVTLLLSYGSDPNSMDITGRTTVLHAVDSHSTACLRLILEAGGHPDPRIPSSLFRSSPLTASCHGGLIDMVELLLEFGADPNARNPEGFTALHSVASAAKSADATKCARSLLKIGANPLMASANGKTPMSVAIVHQNHAVLSLLIGHYRARMTDAQRRDVQLLSTVAEFADIKSMNLFSSSQWSGNLFDLSASSVSTSLKTLLNRRDYNDKIALAFEDLLRSCNGAGPDTVGSDPEVKPLAFGSTASKSR